MSRQNSELSTIADRRDLLERYAPKHDMEFAVDPRDCVIGDSPTLGKVARGYGIGTAEVFVEAQMKSLSEFAGCEKMTTEQLDSISRLIVTNYHYLKLTEIIHFVWLCKSGEYGPFYGRVDGMTIMANLRKYVLNTRNVIIDKEMSMKREKELDRWEREAVPCPEHIRKRLEEKLAKVNIKLK